MRLMTLAFLVSLVVLCAFTTAQETADDWVKKGSELLAEGALEEANQALDKALQLYNERIEKNTDDVDALIEKAKLLDLMVLLEEEPNGTKNATNETIVAFDQVIKVDPNNSEAWYHKATLLYYQGLTGYPIYERDKFFVEAVDALDKAIEIDPKNADAFREKGFIFAQWSRLEEWMGKHEESLKKWGESLDAYESSYKLLNASSVSSTAFYAEAWDGKGFALYKLGRYNESLQAYDEAIALEFIPGQTWISKGLVLSELGMYDEAIDAFDNAFEMDSRDPTALIRKGDVLLMLDNNEEALNVYNQAIEFDQERSYEGAWEGKGVALDRLGRHEEASKAYENVLAIYDASIERNPNYNVMEWTNKGDFLNRIEEYEKAIEAFDKAIEIYPEFSPAWQGKGEAFKAIGKNTEAEAAFTKARELGYNE